MLKILLNLLLNILLGALKSVLLKHIETVNAENITNEDKRRIVFAAFKSDAIEAGKHMKDSLINLAIEVGVSIIKSKLK